MNNRLGSLLSLIGIWNPFVNIFYYLLGSFIKFFKFELVIVYASLGRTLEKLRLIVVVNQKSRADSTRLFYVKRLLLTLLPQFIFQNNNSFIFRFPSFQIHFGRGSNGQVE